MAGGILRSLETENKHRIDRIIIYKKLIIKIGILKNTYFKEV